MHQYEYTISQETRYTCFYSQLFYDLQVSGVASGYLFHLGLLGEDGGPVDAVEAGRQDGDDEDVEDQPDGVDTTPLLAAAVGDLLLDSLLLQIRLEDKELNKQYI